MTRDEIEKMPAGFLMRGLIAEKVFGFSNIKSGYQFIAGRTKSGHLEPIPNYPEDIAAAWLVVEKLAKEPYAWYIHSINLSTGLRYNADYWEETDSPDGEIISYNATAETAPLAICRAALMAVMK